jgi:hypothetical protein
MTQRYFRPDTLKRAHGGPDVAGSIVEDGDFWG